jgi:hypothetical protein
MLSSAIAEFEERVRNSENSLNEIAKRRAATHEKTLAEIAALRQQANDAREEEERQALAQKRKQRSPPPFPPRSVLSGHTDAVNALVLLPSVEADLARDGSKKTHREY